MASFLLTSSMFVVAIVHSVVADAHVAQRRQTLLPHHLKNRAAALVSTKSFASRATRSRHSRMLAEWSTPAHLTSSPPYVIYPGT